MVSGFNLSQSTGRAPIGNTRGKIKFCKAAINTSAEAGKYIGSDVRTKFLSFAKSRTPKLRPRGTNPGLDAGGEDD